MKIYKVKIIPQSSYISQWQSDTIFGSLCWVYKRLYGEKDLREFLSMFDESYPFVVSNGFPGDYLPKPMAGNTFPVDENIKKEDALRIAQKAKKIKKSHYISVDEFNIIINDGRVDIQAKEKDEIAVDRMHNLISRHTDTTMDGGLYEESERFFLGEYLSIYAAIQEGWEDTVFKLFEVLSQIGYGKKITVGKGQFKILDISEFNDFGKVENPNSFITLSNYVPKKDDPTRGQYKILVKYGKLGNEYALSKNPFKKPLIMIQPGAVFWDDEPKYTYGRLVKNISDYNDGVVQCGCTLTIPARITLPAGI